MVLLKTNSGKNFIEHHGWYSPEIISKEILPEEPEPILFLNNKEAICFEIKKHDRSVFTNYFVGVDWIIKSQTAVYVEPKLNKDYDNQTDYLKMLFSALKHSEVGNHTKDLFEIKWDSPLIEIDQKQDLLTPLVIVQFLRVVQIIVRKGLKKSYYKVEHNLTSKIKGKVLVGKTIKQNLLKNKNLNTFCRYDEFGFNGLENGLLKKALVFVKRYLPNLKNLNAETYTTNAFNYINPAFEGISDEVELHDVKHTKTNAFYKEYKEAIILAKHILKRFGYNITNTQNQLKIMTPPFWIDMSKLFELYVLGLLIDRFKGMGVVDYHFGTDGNELDYLLNTKENNKEFKMVVDAKYKPRYKLALLDKELHLDIRQVSGYARLKKVYNTLGISEDKLIKCLIIYPDQSLKRMDLKDWKITEFEEYVGVFKLGVSLPEISKP